MAEDNNIARVSTTGVFMCVCVVVSAYPSHTHIMHDTCSLLGPAVRCVGQGGSGRTHSDAPGRGESSGPSRTTASETL